jgi:hypothetical protein
MRLRQQAAMRCRPTISKAHIASTRKKFHIARLPRRANSGPTIVLPLTRFHFVECAGRLADLGRRNSAHDGVLSGGIAIEAPTPVRISGTMNLA